MLALAPARGGCRPSLVGTAVQVAYKDLKKAVQTSLKQRRGWQQRKGRTAEEAEGGPGSEEELKMLTALMAQNALLWEPKQQAQVRCSCPLRTQSIAHAVSSLPEQETTNRQPLGVLHRLVA